ncbi:hypothetical protein ACIBKX_06600 [Streptomyces sp. NPDC050658]|uniref:hypothetical protein n=1 Tax=unclassified Streptomyces TaxID=2593676 RepID=UPI00342F9503
MTSAIPHFILHESAQDPNADVWFVEPAGFTALPIDILLASQDSLAAERFRTALVPLLGAAPSDAARQQLIAQLASGQQMMAALREAGTVHCSVGLHRDDLSGGESGDRPPLLSLLTLTWRNITTAPPAVTAARAVAKAEGHTRIAYLELPCGPASISETIRMPSPESGLPQQPLLQVHAHLPHPEGKHLVVLSLATGAVTRREQYRAILDQMAELISFDDPRSVAPTDQFRTQC